MDTASTPSSGNSPQLAGSERCESPRAFDGWWFRKVPADPVKKGAEASETWVPFPVIDNDRLEQGLCDIPFREFPDEILVHDESLQRTCKVSYSKMEMSPLYWEGAARPVRRAIWLEMIHLTDNTQGGRPLAFAIDAAIEEAYQANYEWIQTPARDRIVEKIVSLPEPLAAYALIIRQGALDGAWLTEQKMLEQKKNQSTRLVRGYVPYFIAVIAALQGGTETLGKNKTPEMPLALASPFDSAITNNRLSPPRELVFAVHGIGQKFAQRMGKNFVQDCDCLRQGISNAISQRGGSVEDVLLLPVNWRSGLQMGVRAWFLETDKGNEEESFEDLLTRSTLGNIPAIRDAVSDVGLDILLYMTPAYFERIISSTIKEMHRQYKIFSTIYGEEAKKSKVSIIGHSLGSAILADFLTVVVTDELPSTIEKGAREICKHLGFVVDRFFAVGSPIAMFFLLKQLRPVNCIPNIYDLNLLEDPVVDEADLARAEHKTLIPEPEKSCVLRPRDFVFACREFYNIFHPFDPSTLIHPLLFTLF